MSLNEERVLFLLLFLCFANVPVKAVVVQHSYSKLPRHFKTAFNERTQQPSASSLDNNYHSQSDKKSWSNWQQSSLCSRTCGGGVETWTRKCLDEDRGCAGKSEKFRLCNKHRCPAGDTHFRQSQCDHWAKETSANAWEAVVDKKRPCVLLCRIPNGDVVQPQPEVTDGTSCREGSLDVCVRGRCLRVGCDSEIDSVLELDACGVCGGTGSTCSQYDDLEESLSNLYEWHTTGFSRCSKPCGGGWQATDAICVRILHESSSNFSNASIVVADQFCRELPRLDVIKQRCNTHRCLPARVDVTYAWTPDEWGPCSAACGRGTRSRHVVCGRYIRRRSSGSATTDDNAQVEAEPVDHKYCQLSIQPHVNEECMETRWCSDNYEFGASASNKVNSKYRWVTGQWLPCKPIECGIGIRVRQVKCALSLAGTAQSGRNSSGLESKQVIVDDAECVRQMQRNMPMTEDFSHKKPRTKERCYSDKKCGMTNPRNGNDEFLAADDPTTTSLLNVSPAAESDISWSQALPLVSRNEYVTSINQLDRNGKAGEEGRVEFVTGPWSQCSLTCGSGGVMTRAVGCFAWLPQSAAVVRVSDADCSAKAWQPKPPTAQPCNVTTLPPCANDDASIVGIYSTVDRNSAVLPAQLADYVWKYIWAECSQTCGGGEQVGRPYCVERVSGEPIEDEYCIELHGDEPPPLAERPCNFNPCERRRASEALVNDTASGLVEPSVRWFLYNETDCQVTKQKTKCRGYIKRRYVCVATNSNGKVKKVDVTLCQANLGDMPPTRIKCDLPEELLQFCRLADKTWQTGPWSTCSKTCGPDAFRQRTVVCTAEQSKCLATPRPKDRQVCLNLPPCQHDKDRETPLVPMQAAGSTIVGSVWQKSVIRLKLGTYRQSPNQRAFDMKIGETAYVFVNTNIRLRCPVRRGFDKSKIRWLKDGQLLSNEQIRSTEPRFRVTRHGALKIRQIRDQDQGIYTCLAGDQDRANSLVLVMPKIAATNTASSRNGGQSLPIMPSSGARWQLPSDKTWQVPIQEPDDARTSYGDKGPMVDNEDDSKIETVFAIIRPKPVDDASIDGQTPTYSSNTFRAKEDVAVIQTLRADLERSWNRKLPTVDASLAQLKFDDQKTRVVFDAKGNEVTFEWRFENWSDCRSNTGCDGNNRSNGTQTRSVYCLATQTGDMRAVQVVNSSLFQQARVPNMPPADQQCKAQQQQQQGCSPTWRTGQWSECLPEKCIETGLAQRERSVYCAYNNGTRVDDDGLCYSSNNGLFQKQPSATERCKLQQCQPEWLAMPWTSCSRTCGSAMRARNIKCVWQGTQIFAGDICQTLLEQPVTSEPCEKLPKCPEDDLCKDVSKFCGLAANLNLCTLHEYHVKCCRSCTLQQQLRNKRRHQLRNQITSMDFGASMDELLPSKSSPYQSHKVESYSPVVVEQN